MVSAEVLLARGIVVSVLVAVDESRLAAGSLKHAHEKIRHQSPPFARKPFCFLLLRQSRKAVEHADMKKGENHRAGHRLLKRPHELSAALSYPGSVLDECMCLGFGLFGVIP